MTTKERLLQALLTKPWFWFFVQLYASWFEEQKKPMYQGGRPPQYIRERWSGRTRLHPVAALIESGAPFHEQQKAIMPLLFRAIAGYRYGFMEETVAICCLLYPGKPLHLKNSYLRRETFGESRRSMISLYTMWKSIVEHLLPADHIRFYETSGGAFVRFSVEPYVSEVVSMELEDYKTHLARVHNGLGDIVEIKIVSEHNGIGEIEVTKLNREPPKFKDFFLATSDTKFKGSRKSRRKRLRRHKFRNMWEKFEESFR